MTFFEHINWLNFLRNLTGCIGIGAIGSISLGLNLWAQNKLRADSSFSSHLIQLLVYLFANGLGGVAIVYVAANVLNGKNASPLEILIFAIGIVLPIIVAIRSGFIPAKLLFVKVGQREK